MLASQHSDRLRVILFIKLADATCPYNPTTICNLVKWFNEQNAANNRELHMHAVKPKIQSHADDAHRRE